MASGDYLNSMLQKDATKPQELPVHSIFALYAIILCDAIQLPVGITGDDDRRLLTFSDSFNLCLCGPLS